MTLCSSPNDADCNIDIIPNESLDETSESINMDFLKKLNRTFLRLKNEYLSKGFSPAGYISSLFFACS